MTPNNITRKGVKNMSKDDYSYANSVLNSLSCLDCIRELDYEEIFSKISNSNFCLAKDFFNLIFILNRIDNQTAFSDGIINSFQKSYHKYKLSIQSQKVLKKDPYHFLYFLLQFLHIEINNPNMSNNGMQKFFNKTLNDQRNDDYIFELFMNFFENTQNSLISYYFFNIERNVFNCMNCNTYYFYSLKNIIRINIDNAKSSCIGKKLDIYNILDFYFSPTFKQCKNCNNNAHDDIKIVNNARVIIIALERNNHNNNFNADINICFDLDVSKYIFEKNYNNINKNEKNYQLKSLISFNGNKYLSFCKLIINNNKVWFKFDDDNVSKVQDTKELWKFEPQMLIYESREESNKNNDIIKNRTFAFNNCNNQINNNNSNENNQFYRYNNPNCLNNINNNNNNDNFYLNNNNGINNEINNNCNMNNNNNNHFNGYNNCNMNINGQYGNNNNYNMNNNNHFNGYNNCNMNINDQSNGNNNNYNMNNNIQLNGYNNCNININGQFNENNNNFNNKCNINDIFGNNLCNFNQAQNSNNITNLQKELTPNVLNCLRSWEKDDD